MGRREAADGKDRMVSTVGRGLAAGAVGTLVLESATYLDMILTGRRESDLPAQAAAQMTDALGIDLGPARENRIRAIGAILGFANGVALGAIYGLVAQQTRFTVVRGVGLGLAATAASAVPATLAGLTDPRRWGWRGWLEDLFPHLAYGLATSSAYRALRPAPRPGR